MKKLLILMLMASNWAMADNGVLAINDVCVSFGCFTGDSSGFPVTITEPGSYQLTSNLVSSSQTTNVIVISADNVTVDLNGFSIIGPRSCSGFGDTLSCTNAGISADGVSTTGERRRVTVKNGHIKGFDSGVSLANFSSNDYKVSHITASENEFGIAVSNGVISDSIANRNNDSGFSNGLFGSLFVKDSQATGNGNIDAIAFVCSNVYLSGPGTDNCARFTNESSCDGAAC